MRYFIRGLLGLYLGVWSLVIFEIVPQPVWWNWDDPAFPWIVLALFWAGFLLIGLLERRWGQAR